MTTEQYIGPRKVLTVAVDTVKTFGNNEVVVVHYDGGDKELMPKKTFELVVTDVPSDYTTVRTKKFTELRKVLYPIIAECVAVTGESDDVKKAKRTEMLQKVLAAISEVDIKDSEMQPFFDQVLVECNGIINAILFELSTAMSRAINFLWTKDDTRFVPGTDVMNDRTYLEAKKIVEDVPKQANN